MSEFGVRTKGKTRLTQRFSNLRSPSLKETLLKRVFRRCLVRVSVGTGVPRRGRVIEGFLEGASVIEGAYKVLNHGFRCIFVGVVSQ